MSTKPFQELRDKMKPEARKAAEKLTLKFLEDIHLNQLRQARKLSQEQVSSKLKIKQASVSKLERQADMYVSTLRHYIKAIGGDLVITAKFPDGDVRINQFVDAGRPKRALPTKSVNRVRPAALARRRAAVG